VLSKLAGMSKPTIAMLAGRRIGGRGSSFALAVAIEAGRPTRALGIPGARTLGNFLAR